MRWRYQTGDVVSSSPAVGSDGTIYVGSADDYVYAFNPDGTLQWRYQTGDDVSSSPAVGSDGTIYVGSYDYYVYAINPDGTLKWRYQTGDYVDSSPAIGSAGTIYVGSNDDYVYAIGSPANDTCAGAIAVNCGDCITGSTAGANDDHDCGTDHGGPDVVYELTLATDQYVHFLGEADYDADWTVATTCDDTTGDIICIDYSGNPDGDPVLSCGGFTAAGYSSLDETRVLSAGTYTIWVDGYYNDSEGDYALEITCSSPPPTDTPTPAPTPTVTAVPPTSTPSCEVLGCTLDLPSHLYHPGDTFHANAVVCNPDPASYGPHYLLILLDVYGNYYFAPSFAMDLDYYEIEAVPGIQMFDVIPAFAWPPDAGEASGIFFYAAMTDTGITDLFGEMDIFEFGWTK